MRAILCIIISLIITASLPAMEQSDTEIKYFNKQLPAYVFRASLSELTYKTTRNETVHVVGVTKDGLTVVYKEQEHPLDDPLLGILVSIGGRPAVIPYGPYNDLDGFIVKANIFTIHNCAKIFGHFIAIPGTILALFGAYKIIKKLEKRYKQQAQPSPDIAISNNPASL